MATEQFTKVCVKCLNNRPLTDFYLRSDRKTGDRRRNDCKFCCVKRCRSWHVDNGGHVKQYKQSRHLSKRDEILEKQRRFRKENAARINAAAAAKKKEYRESNREACNARIRDWKKRNPGATNFYGRTRHARLRQAVPVWADLDKIEALYIESDRISKETGIRHHVDHIVPLIGRGNRVCGLHCEQNLRIITAEENLKKNGHHWPDMP